MNSKQLSKLYLKGLWLQMVTAGNGSVALKLKSRLTFFGLDCKYSIFKLTSHSSSIHADKNVNSHASLYCRTTSPVSSQHS